MGQWQYWLPKVRELIQFDKEDMALVIKHLKTNWSRIAQTVTASDCGEVSDIMQHAKGSNINQSISANGHSKVSCIDQDYEQGINLYKKLEA